MSKKPTIILKKLGLSEDDFKTSQKLFQEMPPPPPFCRERGHKVEIILGYSDQRLRRSKALKVLGTSEEKIEEENSKNLGALGAGGRRRSFIVEDSESESGRIRGRSDSAMKRKRRGNSFAVDLRKKSRNDVIKLRRRLSKDKEQFLEGQMNSLKVALNDAKREISRLSERVTYLENRQKRGGAAA